MSDKKIEIGKLIKALAAESDQMKKRVLRRKLRSLGHEGGLGDARPATKKKIVSKKKTSKKSPPAPVAIVTKKKATHKAPPAPTVAEPGANG